MEKVPVTDYTKITCIGALGRFTDSLQDSLKSLIYPFKRDDHLPLITSLYILPKPNQAVIQISIISSSSTPSIAPPTSQNGKCLGWDIFVR